jgi:hypothetical protein
MSAPPDLKVSTIKQKACGTVKLFCSYIVNKTGGFQALKPVI